MKQLPNLLTCARIIAVIPLFYCGLVELWPWVFWLFIFAGVSDALDGFVARRFDGITEFGKRADPAADKLLFAAVVIVLTTKGQLPIWLAIVLFGREGIILGGALAYRFLYKSIEVSPLFIGKVNTVVQIVLLLIIVGGLAEMHFIGMLAVWVDPFGFGLLTVFAILSAAQYVFHWSRKAHAASRSTTVENVETDVRVR